LDTLSCFYNCNIPAVCVHLNQMFIVKYQKLAFCAMCIVKMKISLGERA